MKLLADVNVLQHILSPSYGGMLTLVKWDRVPKEIKKLLDSKFSLYSLT